MKVLFVNVVDPTIHTHVHYYPLSFAYLVSYASQKAPFEYDYTETLNKTLLRKLKPNVVALTCITENYNLAKQYAEMVKNFDSKIKVIIGGVHISAVPRSLSRKMDIGVLGEGEQTFLELLENDMIASLKIKGIVCWRNRKIHITEERGLIEPLDLIPHPKREMYPLDRPQYLLTSRGCLHKCKFCSSTRFWRKLRLHSPEYVAEEIRSIKETFNISMLHLFDDTFTSNVERLREIRDLLEPLGLKYSVNARANLINEEVAQTLKDMRVVTVSIGFESNSERILNFLQKGTTVTDNQRAVDLLRKHGIKVTGSFIRDIPIETEADLKVTYDFIRRNNLPFDMYMLMKYPATPLYEGCEDWDSYKVRYYEAYSRKLRKMLYRIKTYMRRIK